MDKTENTIREKETEEPEHKKKKASTVTCFISFLDSYFHSNIDLLSSLVALFAGKKVVGVTTEMIEC